MEKKKKRSTGRNGNCYNGVIVAYTLKKLQEEKGEKERISFDELYHEVIKTKPMDRETVARRLKEWWENNLLKGMRGQLFAFDKKGRMFEEIENKRAKEDYTIGMKKFKTAFFQVGEPTERCEDKELNQCKESKPKDKNKKNETNTAEDTGKNTNREQGENDEEYTDKKTNEEQKANGAEYTRKKINKKSEIKEYMDAFIQFIKMEREVIGTGNEVAKKVDNYISKWLSCDKEDCNSISQETMLRYILDLLNPKNKKICDLLQIEIGIQQELPVEAYAQDEEEIPEECYTSIRHRASIDPEEVTALDFDDKDAYLKLKRMKLLICDKSQVWENHWTEHWGGSEDVAYMEFILKRNHYGEIWAVAYEILKVLCDNEEKTEGLSRKEIIKELYQFIPDTYLSRKEFGEEFDQALRFVEEEGMAKRTQGDKWVLGELIR